MNDIAITLPLTLWVKICSGEKRFEFRKSIPQRFDNENSRCYVILKGTNLVAGYLCLSTFTQMPNNDYNLQKALELAKAPFGWVWAYYSNSPKICAWKISHVYYYKERINVRLLLGLMRNPQSYVYVDRPSLNINPIKIR